MSGERTRECDVVAAAGALTSRKKLLRGLPLLPFSCSLSLLSSSLSCRGRDVLRVRNVSRNVLVVVGLTVAVWNGENHCRRVRFNWKLAVDDLGCVCVSSAKNEANR